MISISFIILWFGPFFTEEGFVLKRLYPCAPNILTWYPQWKPMFKTVWERYSTSGVRTLMCLTNKFCLSVYFPSWLWRKEKKHEWPTHNSPEAIGLIFYFMMMVHPDQDDPKSNPSHMTCRSCVNLLLDLYSIDAIIDTKILNAPHSI